MTPHTSHGFPPYLSSGLHPSVFLRRVVALSLPALSKPHKSLALSVPICFL